MTEFRQHPIYSNYYVSKEGTFYFYNSRGQKSDIKRGTVVKNKYGKPLSYEVCITLSKGIYTVVNVGRLVLETYVSLIPRDDYEVDHIDHDPTNNNLSNLRWVTRHENLKNRTLPKWTTDRHAQRLETAKKMGFDTWGALLRAGRLAKKNGTTLNI